MARFTRAQTDSAFSAAAQARDNGRDVSPRRLGEPDTAPREGPLIPARPGTGPGTYGGRRAGVQIRPSAPTLCVAVQHPQPLIGADSRPYYSEEVNELHALLHPSRGSQRPCRAEAAERSDASLLQQ